MNMPVPDKNNVTAQRGLTESLNDHLRIIADDLAEVRLRIDSLLVSPEGAISEMLRHVSSRSGKMLRPAMVLLVGDACGEINDKHIEIATVVELLHAATLLHDDVLDEAQARRKASTANCLWGNEAAVLLGDFLLGKVFLTCSRMEPRQVAQVLSETALEICSGELMQNIQRQNFELTESAYFEIVKAKTAILFGICGYLGSLASGGDERQNELFREFGIKVGMAFQITDDLLDITGNEEKVGKTLGTDLAGCKMTLPVIRMLGQIPSHLRPEAIRNLTGTIDPQRLRRLLTDSDTIEYTQSVAGRFCEEAVETLHTLDNSVNTDRLIDIAKSVAVRYF